LQGDAVTSEPLFQESLDHLTKVAEKFHAHLDVCPRCRHRPFDLCAEGARSLRSVEETEGEGA